jgi:DNA repair protein RadC
MKKIKDLAPFNRPREKLKERGVEALSNVELLAILLGSGIPGKNVMQLASQIAPLLTQNGSRLNFEQLSKVEGIGIAKASQILAAFELGRRHLFKNSVKIKTAKDVLPYLSDIADKQQEHFVCLTLNGAHEMIEKRTITVGLLNSSPVHPREVFADAITDRAASIILAHNHPSGNLMPSNEDITITATLMQVGELLGIRVLDHLIVSKRNYFSFREQNLMELAKDSDNDIENVANNQ